QPEHFGAEVVAPVRPAQTAAGDGAGAQVNAFDPPRIDEDLAPRHRLGKAWDLRRIELERERFLAGGSKGVSAKDGGDDAPIEAEQAVVVDRSDAGEAGADRVFGLGAFRSPITCKGGIRSEEHTS